MAAITCPSCKTELTEYVRFCPECGARIPEPAADAAPDAPTMLIGPGQPDAESPAAVPPTTRLDSPVAPTVVLPPIGEPPPPDSAGAPTMMMPPAGQAPASPPAALPPLTPPPPTAPPAFGGQLPTGAPYPSDPAPQPTYGGQLPTGQPPYPGEAPAKPGNRRTLWWVLGGAGCLGLLAVVACAVIGVLTLLGGQVSSVFSEIEATVESEQGGGGIVPGDSPLTGGEVLFSDDFESAFASGLSEDEDASSRYAYEDGAYVIEVKEPETIVWARVDGTYSDARIAVDAEVPAGTDVSAAGLIFHYQDQDNFYLFSVSNDGYYALELLQNNEWVILIDWTISDVIDGSFNTMRVETQGDQIALYVNDQLLEETSDGTFTEGEVALAVSSLQDSTALVRFDNMLIEQN
jgi:hypothetical protein